MAEPLQQAENWFSSAPKTPAAESTQHLAAVMRQEISQTVTTFVQEIAAWRAGIDLIQKDLASSLPELARLPSPEAYRVAVSGLDVFIDTVEKDIEDERRAIESSDLRSRQVVATLKKSSDANAKFAKRTLDRLRAALMARHKVKIEFLEFLKRLRWDHDPDARGGPTFDKADDLISHLKDRTR